MSSTGKANAALAAAIIFLLLSTFAAYFAFARLRTSQVWVGRTHNVQLVLHQFAGTTARASRLKTEFVDSGDISLVERRSGSRGQRPKFPQVDTETDS